MAERRADSSAAVPRPHTRAPRIPLSVMDAPTQRFYAAALFVAVHGWKWSRMAAVHLLGRPPSHGVWAWVSPTTYFSAILLDFIVCYALYWLAIPPRTAASAPAAAPAPARPPRAWTWVHYTALFVGVALIDTWLVGGESARALLAALMPGPAAMSLGERKVRAHGTKHAHIAGQHTVHILPPGTARLERPGACMCVGGAVREVQIPILFHDTTPSALTYTVTDPATAHVTEHVVAHPKTRAYAPHDPKGRTEAQLDVPARAKGLSLAERRRARRAKARAPAAVSVHYLRLTQPGEVRVVSVRDKHGYQAQMAAEDMVRVVACPGAALVQRRTDYCPGEVDTVQVALSGTAPLTLEYDVARAGVAHARTLTHDTPGAPASISLDLDTPGVESLSLRRVIDACGNEVPVDAHVDVTVHATAEVQWDARQCGPGRPLKLRRGAAPLPLPVRVDVPSGAPPRGTDARWDVRVEFVPDTNASLATPLTSDAAWSKTQSWPAGVHSWPVTQPGTYVLTDVHSAHCPGVVRAPWTCEVVDVPPPRASIHFESIDDPCAGTVGVKALSVLEGEPPFKLVYEVQRAGQAAQRHVRVVQAQSRDMLEFWPSTEGEVTYRFLSLDDANYQRVPLDGPSFTQRVRPRADAAFVTGASHDAVVSSCGQASAHADVSLSGPGPYELTYAIRGASGLPIERTATNLSSGRNTLDLALPDDVLQQRGRATVSLLRLRDGQGCERSLTTRDLRIDVRPAQAAAALAESDVWVREHETARVPVRLQGTAPWELTYVYTSPDHETAEGRATLHDANEALVLAAPGTYELTGVRDAYCHGAVLAPTTARVHVRARPGAVFSGVPLANGSVVVPPVCQGAASAAEIVLHGQPPVDLAYVHRLPRHGLAPAQVQRHTLASTEPHTTLALDTSLAGWHTYEIIDVGDVHYAQGRAGGAPLRLEAQVWPRPSAAWAATPRLTACVGGSWDEAPTLQLSGTPPFTVHLALVPTRTDGAAVPMRFVQTSDTPTLAVHAPDALGVPGTWELRVEDVRDAHCAPAPRAPPVPPLTVRVVESAAVVAAAARTHYCVGEKIDFVLQGTPPWTVSYAFQGKTSQVTSWRPEFTRMADRPGTLSVLGAAQASNQCRRAAAPIECEIHALPSSHISAGAHRVESLHQGGQTEIVFTLEGTPPFAFTYQRTEPVDRHARPQVLETHTVDEWHEHEYRVPTSQEGTWSVLWMQDRWCQVAVDDDISGPASWDHLVRDA